MEIMPFGKYKYLLVNDVPTGYLRWLVEQDWFHDFGGRWPTMREEIYERVGKPEPKAEAEPAQPKIDSLYREMALKYHPDRGGSQEAMVAINDVFDRLRHVFERY